MDPNATWRIITDIRTEPDARSSAALDMLVWYARDLACDVEFIDACETILRSELALLARLTT